MKTMKRKNGMFMNEKLQYKQVNRLHTCFEFKFLYSELYKSYGKKSDKMRPIQK